MREFEQRLDTSVGRVELVMDVAQDTGEVAACVLLVLSVDRHKKQVELAT
jgi:hypothetical protein